jgi:membrane-bound ClpP family serine protease
MTISNQNYKWIIILLFLGIIIIPSQISSPTIKSAALGVLGGLCLIFEVLSLRSLKNTEEKYQAKFRQTVILFVLTILLLVVNFLI